MVKPGSEKKPKKVVSPSKEQEPEVPTKKAVKTKVEANQASVKSKTIKKEKSNDKSKSSSKSSKNKDSKKKDKKDKKKEKKSARKEEKKESKKPKKKVVEDDEEDEMADEFDGVLMPGQKHPTPADGDGTRIFYETLLKQKPSSKMAQKWCLEYGVLPQEEANKIVN